MENFGCILSIGNCSSCPTPAESALLRNEPLPPAGKFRFDLQLACGKEALLIRGGGEMADSFLPPILPCSPANTLRRVSVEVTIA